MRRTRRADRLAVWRRTLPDRLGACASAWGVTVEEPLPSGAYSPARVFAVRGRDGTPMVLKLAPPGQGLESEAVALAAFNGRGAARLIASDLPRGALLLERLRPGTSLRSLAEQDDDAATLAAAEVIAILPRPPPGAILAEAAGWVRAIEWCAGLPKTLRDRALGLARELARDAEPQLLLHGDLHHGNLLRAGMEWRAVDPKGLLGEATLEAAALLRNPPGSPLLLRAPRRVAILAEATGLPRDRLAGWGYVASAMAAAWALEDGTDATPWLAAAAALEPCLPR